MSSSATIPTTSGAVLGPQLMVHRHRPDPLLLVPARTCPDRGYMNKPAGGLWTSSYVDGSSDWVRWCRQEDFGSVDADPWWLLMPRPDARLIEIDHDGDLATVMNAFGRRGLWTWVPERRTLDFDAMVRDGFDGLHLTERGAVACHWDGWETGLSLNAWDCESTVWFHWTFDSVMHLPHGDLFGGGA